MDLLHDLDYCDESAGFTIIKPVQLNYSNPYGETRWIERNEVDRAYIHEREAGVKQGIF